MGIEATGQRAEMPDILIAGIAGGW